MNFILLQATTTKAADPSGGMWTMPIMMGLMFVVVYFFMIRPQSKRQKEEEEMRKNLKKGDKVITVGGILGKIINFEEEVAIVEVDNNTKLRIEKNYLRLVPNAEAVTSKS